MDAKTIKAEIKRRFGIGRVSVTTSSGRSKWICARIIPLNHEAGYFRASLQYDKLFPESFGNACMRTVYPGSAALSAQNWGGNIASHMISMGPADWGRAFATLDAAQNTGAA